MLNPNSPSIVSAFLATLFTWGVTALGAALVFIIGTSHRWLLDISLGFAGGVMTAASFWSLIAPALEKAEESVIYGSFSFVPVGVGFALGAGFVCLADVLIQKASKTNGKQKHLHEAIFDANAEQEEGDANESNSGNVQINTAPPGKPSYGIWPKLFCVEKGSRSWNRIVLLVIAITVHNIPEGLAVGVSFGAVGKTAASTFANAQALALGIGIQNFPEGLAVSLPLAGLGMAKWKAFLWGQFSGMVEPIAGVLGCLVVSLATPVLPYALSFAAGAMIWVVMDDIIPEAHSCGNGKLASFGSIVGFLVMMSLDVFFG